MLTHCFISGKVPLINSIGEDENSNEYVGLDVNHVTHTLALSLKPFKIINLNPSGGLKDSNGKVRVFFALQI